MPKQKLLKKFVEGRGYTKEDWDAVDSPELTDEELARSRPAREVLPPEFFRAIDEARRARGLGAHLLHEGERVRLMQNQRAQSVAVNRAGPR
jgi:uncharacterized protein (DUF4415 family)